VYVIDTSALINLKIHYPRDIPMFAPIWAKLGELAAKGSLISPREAFRELTKGDDAAADWAVIHERVFIDADEEQADIVSEIWNRIPGLDREKFGPFADPWCVALAVVRSSRTGRAVYVVTDESKTTSGRIPAICRAFNVPCLSLIDFLRIES
jgi:hypothetical protein